MLEKFLSKFKVSSKVTKDEDNSFFKDVPSELFTLLNVYGGSSFNNGLYRLHTFKSSLRWVINITEHFKKYSNNIYPFGYDWMGRQFCLGKSNNIIYMFDPATGEDLEFQQNILLLHENDFVEDTDDMLSVNLFNKLLKLHNISQLSYNECFGYKVPLFLGGSDSIENYQKQDLEVYWHFEMQLYMQVKDLPPGTKIKDIKFE